MYFLRLIFDFEKKILIGYLTTKIYETMTETFVLFDVSLV